jgi:hypothetical protein
MITEKIQKYVFLININIRDKGFNRPKMTYYRLKNGFTRPKYFDDQIDKILFLYKKSPNLLGKQTKNDL